MKDEKETIINKEIIFCDKCRSMHLFNLYIDNKTIYIKLTCKCYKNKVILFDDYLKSLQNKELIEPYCDINIEHNNTTSIYFCKECNKHYCTLCMNNHSFFLPFHTISEINTNPPYDKENSGEYYCKDCAIYYTNKENDSHFLHNVISLQCIDKKVIELSNNIELSKFHLNKTIKQVKDNLIENLQSEISNIEKNYDNCIKRNNKMLSLLKVLVDTYYCYHNKDINLFENIINHEQFNYTISLTSSMQISEQIKEMNTFLDSYTIIDIPIKNSILINDDVIKYNISGFSNQTETSFLVVNQKLIVTANGNLYFYLIKNGFHKYVSDFCISKDWIIDMTNFYEDKIICATSKEIFIVDCQSDTTLNVVLSFTAAHTQKINKVIPISKDIIASCSNEIKLWNVNNKTCIYKTNRDKGIIYSILFLKRKFIIPFTTKETLCFLNVTNYKIKEGFNVQNCSISKNNMVEISRNRFLLGTQKSRVYVINVDSYQVESTIELSSQMPFTVGFTSINLDYIICYDENNNGYWISRINVNKLTIKVFNSKYKIVCVKWNNGKLYCINSVDIQIKKGNNLVL